MPAQCAWCGAAQIDGMDCQTLHEYLTGYDFTPANAVPHAIHFLQVTCFMVQHERYSDEALVWAQTMLRMRLETGMSARDLRRFMTSRAQGSDSSTRTWRFNRAPDAQPLPKIAWEITIADVAQRMGREVSYAELVTRWAHATLRQMSALLV